VTNRFKGIDLIESLKNYGWRRSRRPRMKWLEWYHWLNGHVFKQAPGDGEGQRKPGVLQSMGSQKARHDWTELNWCLFLRNICLDLWPLFDWVVCFSGIVLYKLIVYFGNEPFDGCFICYAIIFSHSEFCLFTVFIVSFAV